MQEKIKYESINEDKADLVYIINAMIPVYQMHKHHTQVLECEQWLTMLNRTPIKTEYTIDAILALKNILNDGVNYLIAVTGDWNTGELSMKLMTKIIGLFNKNEGGS